MYQLCFDQMLVADQMQVDLLNLRRICLVFEGVEADEPATVSEQFQASHSKVTKWITMGRELLIEGSDSRCQK